MVLPNINNGDSGLVARNKINAGLNLLPVPSPLTTVAVFDFGGEVFDAQAYGWLPDGTDRSVQALALLTIVSNAGGGTIYFPPAAGVYRADSQLFIPNTLVLGTAPNKQVNIRFTGAGGGANWYSTSRNVAFGYPLAPNCSILDLRYSGPPDGNAKIETRGIGALIIDNLQILDGTPTPTNTTPFIHTTNTCIKISSCSFLGCGNANQDGIVFGGPTTKVQSNDVDAAFQGYGSIVDGNFFSLMGRGIYLRTFANSIPITNNFFLGMSGTVVIESNGGDGNPPNHNTGLIVVGNFIEMIAPVVYGVKLTATRWSTFNNSFDDAGITALSCYNLNKAALGSCYDNIFTVAQNSQGNGVFITQAGDATQLIKNTIISAQSGNPINTYLGGTGQSTASILANRVIVTGAYQPGETYPGQLNLVNITLSDHRLSLGNNNGTNTGYIDSFNNAGGGLYLSLNPSGGSTLLGGHANDDKSANYPVLTTDSSIHFSNLTASGEVDFTLPSDPTAFLINGAPYYYFRVSSANILKIIAGNGFTTINVGGVISASGGNITSNVVGSTIKLSPQYGNPSRAWIAEAITGTWIVN